MALGQLRHLGLLREEQGIRNTRQPTARLLKLLNILGVAVRPY
jgi:hypothetical protein